MSRAWSRLSIAALLLAAAGQSAVTPFALLPALRGDEVLEELVASSAIAAGLFALSLVVAGFAWGRAEPGAARRRAGLTLLLALLLPAANALTLLWGPTPRNLVRAAAAGDVSGVRRCLLLGADPDAISVWRGLGFVRQQGPALAEAAAGGHDAVVLALLEGGAALDASDHSALEQAVFYGRTESVRLLLARGADTTGVLEHALTFQDPPRHALRSLPSLELLLEPGRPIDPPWLHLRAMHLPQNAFGQLLARRETPARRRERPLVALLNAIALGDSARAVALYRENAARIAAPPPEVERARALYRVSCRVRPKGDPLAQLHDEALLALAAKFGATSFVELLLSRGAPVDPPDTQKSDGPRSPLHLAAAAGHRDAVRILMDAGADLARSEPGWGTPLHAAVAGGHADVVDLLLERGADVDAPASAIASDSPIFWATRLGDRAMVEHLVARGASLARVGFGSRTLLDVARENGHAELATYLERTAPRQRAPADRSPAEGR